jgi:hypothetical protein
LSAKLSVALAILDMHFLCLFRGTQSELPHTLNVM